MARALPHAIGFILPAVIVLTAGPGGAWTFLPLVILYVILPAIDALVGLNPRNPGAAEEPSLSDNPAFRAITWLWVPAQLALIVWGLERVASGTMTPVETVGTALSIGLTSGAIGMTFAHELIHRPSRLERLLGDLLLISVTYPHFAIEHVHGHHRHVGTPRDPATARYGESLYAFLPRTVVWSVASAWRIEVRRLAKHGRPALSPSNRMLRYALVQSIIYLCVGLRYGMGGMLFLAAQSIVAFALIETINYIEHYGLVRREVTPGQYERVMPWHSWDSSHRVSNWILINLARHADHHVAASKRYQVLHALDAAPQLPTGYGAMFVLALAPPLWRRVMDPRVERWRERHLIAETRQAGG
ncbi:MAG: alkane 1-monooxygenase [Vicinamibacterales bacterium]